ncbi:uncharacterized protein PAC_00766 [Phialocephala subalpina]|uniref:BTB domain-containing protein n=1 Tax=Phialocephala subalpina TaxID=576137 RepID=A0A1L7WDN6_9HELO|nr:uncharacterized protein PAC_00766 [Phialocephala subalpina]
MARTRGGFDRPETSLDAAMRAPSTTAPDVVVLDHIEEGEKPRDLADPKKDLWLSTVDGRYTSPIIHVRVGPSAETFPVHKAILMKYDSFSAAIDGKFREAVEGVLELPEEDPDIFSFVVAWLYEEKFVPIRSLEMALVAEPNKGKGREGEDEGNSSTESATDSSGGSDESARNRRHRRRREQRALNDERRKQPGRHRPTCNCATCTMELMGPPCWSCGASRNPPPPRRYHHHPGGPPPQQPVIIGPNGYPRPQPPRRNRDRRRAGRVEEVVIIEPLNEDRMSDEDLRTWSLAYTLSIDVYVCAERYLMQDFKAAIAAYIVNSFEIAGLEAAVPAVLQSCKTLLNGVRPMDPLLRKVFSRVGFLQARLAKNFPEETGAFFSENPELPVLIMKEMVERMEEDRPDGLPPMDAPNRPFGPGPDDIIHIQGRRRRYDRPVIDD